ncbi:MAG: hypothetical protein ACLP01_10350 [Solirubrobacteraceae bacterium]
MAIRAGLDGPSRTIIVEPIDAPLREEPLTVPEPDQAPAPSEPTREPEKVPA